MIAGHLLRNPEPVTAEHHVGPAVGALQAGLEQVHRR